MVGLCVGIVVDSVDVLVVAGLILGVDGTDAEEGDTKTVVCPESVAKLAVRFASFGEDVVVTLTAGSPAVSTK